MPLRVVFSDASRLSLSSLSLFRDLRRDRDKEQRKQPLVEASTVTSYNTPHYFLVYRVSLQLQLPSKSATVVDSTRLDKPLALYALQRKSSII